MKKYKFIWTVKSECGPIRKKNEDAVFPLESGSSELPIKAGVFDGMGGHKKGEVASDLAYKTMYKDLNNITDYVNTANKDILEYQSSNEEAKGMGTTMTVVEICLLYTSPSPRDRTRSRMPSSA